MSSRANLEKIKVFGIDVDGTLTDGLYTISEDGKLTKGFNTRDFYAMSRLIQLGIEVVIVTGAKDDTIDRKIEISGVKGIQLLKHCKDKRTEFGNWLVLRGWTLGENAGFIGDAENDLGVMESVVWCACPKDAAPEIQELSHYISEYNGGRTAVHNCIRQFFTKLGRQWISEDRQEVRH